MSQEEKTTAPAAGSPAPGPQPEGTAQEKLEALAEEARSLLRSEDSQREDTLEGKVTWRSFVSGEILLNPAFRRQIPLLIVILLFTIVYIDNRFAVQQQIIEIDRKEKALTEMKYIALTRSSELTEMTRQQCLPERTDHRHQPALPHPRKPRRSTRHARTRRTRGGKHAARPGKSAALFRKRAGTSGKKRQHF